MIVPREPLPFATGDVSALAKSLRSQWASRAAPPGPGGGHVPSHLEMLNMLARAAGHRNFQHLRARLASGPRVGQAAQDPPAQAGPAIVLRAARYFDPQGRLGRWPAQRSIQDLCLWAIWSRIPPRRSFDEREISAVLARLHLFGDPAILRRTMCHTGLMTRSQDGRDYRRIERAPSPDGAALIRHLRERAP
ncbi:hypothetical protein VQ03_08700 [Methylobacterium tarhaniae]|uniref:DUF2087 domain-containing protein n=1 Tax=Methylobacterium tarhaniae TaxID=1187852 RepID=A0A0J6TBK6_9HYPH|nr:DUF2087 domain-containing protein [Methylobacterium tarhaniae]KMO43244.1 hypothetical protein VQ03_08700 [Methylobacterium tarhaniae]